MFLRIKNKLPKLFSSKYERSIKIKKNLFYSIIFKGITLIVNFLLVPLTLNYVSKEQYGVWLTLSSIFLWLNSFDLGIMNGLRNKLAANYALGNNNLSQIYISTSYAILFFIALFFFIIFNIFNNFVNWEDLLKYRGQTNLSALVLLVCIIFCLQFIIQTINPILLGIHEVAKSYSISLIVQVVTFASIFFLPKTQNGSLLVLILIIGGIPIIIQLLITIWFFSNKYKFLAPKFNLIKLKYTKQLFNTGISFFLIQIGGLLLLQTDNFIVNYLLGPANVTLLNISYRVFSVPTTVFIILISPFWSAYTDAFVKEDFNWINDVRKKMILFFILLSLATVFLFFLAPYIYHYWIGDSVRIPSIVSFFMMLYTIGYNWLLIQCSFLNGIEKIRLQLYCYIGSTIINIPLAIFFVKKIGVAGVTLSNCIVLFVMGSILYIQANKIANRKATGIWFK